MCSVLNMFGRLGYNPYFPQWALQYRPHGVISRMDSSCMVTWFWNCSSDFAHSSRTPWLGLPWSVAHTCSTWSMAQKTEYTDWLCTTRVSASTCTANSCGFCSKDILKQASWHWIIWIFLICNCRKTACWIRCFMDYKLDRHTERPFLLILVLKYKVYKYTGPSENHLVLTRWLSLVDLAGDTY